MNRLKTLRVRFALWTAGLLLIALMLFGLFVYINMSRSLAASLDDTLQLTATQLAAEVEVRNGQLVSVENFVDATQVTQLRENGLSMRLLGLAGQTLQVNGPYKNLPQPPDDYIISNQSAMFTTVPGSDSQDSVRIYTTPVIDNNQVVGILQVAQNFRGIRQTLDQLLITLLIGGPLIVLIAGGGGYFLAARALSPIDKISRTARKISTEDLSARLNLSATDDEVGRLAATFDSMLTRLDDGFQRERRFTADASHELRTPLAAMQTILSTTLAQQRTNVEYEQALVDLAQETDRMRTLTQGLLHLARNEVAIQPDQFENINLSTLLQDVTDTLSPLAEEKGLNLICNVPDNLTLIGDGDGLIRMFVNLVANAIKYTECGKITVTANRYPNRAVEITIVDTGVGIIPENLPHIFDRFYRADKSRSTDGSGLGLAIALNVAQAHNGTITVNSELGKGSSFNVRLATI